MKILTEDEILLVANEAAKEIISKGTGIAQDTLLMCQSSPHTLVVSICERMIDRFGEAPEYQICLDVIKELGKILEEHLKTK